MSRGLVACLLASIAVLGAAEKLTEIVLTKVPFATARDGLLNGLLHEANNYGPVAVTRLGPTRFENTFKHPRGGSTIERCEVLHDRSSFFELRVDAASPTVPFGDQFQTRVVVSLEDAGGDVRLRARSNVHWLRSKRPMGMISSRVEKAAEKGAAEAYAVLARCLMDGGGASEAGFASLVASKARPHRKKIVSCAVLGSLVAFLQYHADDALPDDPSGTND